jgi:hypothetical protein
MKLRDFTVGDTVVLKGALSPDRAFFIGDIKNGYYLLWENKKARLEDKPWASMALASHEAEKA